MFAATRRTCACLFSTMLKTSPSSSTMAISTTCCTSSQRAGATRAGGRRIPSETIIDTFDEAVIRLSRWVLERGGGGWISDIFCARFGLCVERGTRSTPKASRIMPYHIRGSLAVSVVERIGSKDVYVPPLTAGQRKRRPPLPPENFNLTGTKPKMFFWRSLWPLKRPFVKKQMIARPVL